MGRSRVLVLAAAALPAVLVLAAGLLTSAPLLAVLLATAATLVLGAALVQVVRRQRALERRVARLEKATAGRAARPDPLRTRPEDVAATVRVDGLPLPPVELRFMREDDERFLSQARDIAGLVRANQSRPDAAVLDVGSGYGRLAVGLMADPSFTGSYLGFDILPRHVAWCRDVITAQDARFRFAHLDVRNERYNPKGTLDGGSVPFPTDDATFDAATLFSVFTHLYQPVSAHYLRELHRVLRPGGVVVGTWFLLDDDRLEAASSEASLYPMRHALADGSRCMRLDDPLHAIAFPRTTVESLAADAGLEVVDVRLGTWADPEPRPPVATVQDLVVLRRP